MKRKALVALMLTLVSTSTIAATQDANLPLECGAGDYVVSISNNTILINGEVPIQQQVLLNKGHQLKVWLLESMGQAAEYQRDGRDMQLKLFDYPDGVHPQIYDRMDCRIVHRGSK